jgi:xylan 1,4-beta-xylosidase
VNISTKLWPALICLLISLPVAGQQPQLVAIDATAPATPFPHYWEEMFGSGRAILSLREDYRQDLRAVKNVTGLRFVRFHGIFLDEVGVYTEDRQGNPHYNFTYVDQIYDGLLHNGVRPFVELSFMPKDLAARPDHQGFWYKPVVSPPKNYAAWDDLITQFTRHLVDRYGIDEVSQWYFEVWNEPNLKFWSGQPEEATYFELYDHTARAIKKVNERLRVGGPSTAQAAWIGDFIAHTVQNNVPLDFVSSHIYGMDKASVVFGTDEVIPKAEMVYRGTKWMHDQIQASARPNLPLIVSEFSASRVNTGNRDTLYMGPWLANVVRECDGLTKMMSFWPFADVFEEHGVPSGPFAPEGGRGLIAPDDIPKPSYVAFALLHRLGEQRIPNPADDAIVTRRPDKTLVIALWNAVETGSARAVELKFRHLPVGAKAVIYRLDEAHGDTRAAFRAMGSPRYPTSAQVAQLWKAAKITPAETSPVTNSWLTLQLPAQGLALIEIR